MKSALLAQSQNSLSQEDVLFQKAALGFVQGNLVDQEVRTLLLERLLGHDISSIQDYLLFLKKSLSLLFLSRNEDSFFAQDSWAEIMQKICKNGFFQNFPLIQALQDLIFFFLKRSEALTPPKLSPRGCPLIEPLSNEKERPLPDLERGSLLSILWFLLGKMSGKEEWVQAAFRIATWYLKILDQNFLPFAALWKEERNFREKELLVTLFLMFDAFAPENQQEQMNVAKERILEKINASHEEVPLPFFFLLLGHEIDRWKTPSFASSEKEKKEKISLDPDLLLALYSGNHLESAVTFLGNRSTLGVIHVGDVHIRSFGPQWFPIGDLSRFGIMRFPFSKGLLGDLEWKKKERGYSLRGCVALAGGGGEDFSCWMDVKNLVEMEKFSLELQFHGDFKERLGVVFFVSAKSALVEGQMDLKSETFQRYEGSVRKVSFKGKAASLEVRAHNLSCMHLIPLGQSRAFWGSNFLLAYEVSPENPGASFLIERG